MQGSSGSALNHNQILVTSPDLDTTPRWSPGQPASGRRVLLFAPAPDCACSTAALQHGAARGGGAWYRDDHGSHSAPSDGARKC